jgi:hypothetical protein
MTQKTLRVLFQLYAIITLVPIGTEAHAQRPPGVYFEFEGLNVNGDEFDGVVAQGFGCAEEAGKDLFRSAGIAPRRCLVEDTLLKLLRHVYRQTGNVRPYLNTRGAKCGSSGKLIKCQLRRFVTTLSHTGDRSKGAALRDRFTIVVLLSESGAPERVTLIREGIGR